jgi:hypothetical protein
VKTKKTKSKSFYKKISMKYCISAVILILAGIFYFTPVRGMVAHRLAMQGKYYFNGGAYDLEKAVKWYKSAVFVNDKTWVAHYQLARIYFVKNDLKTALKEIDKALAVDPKNKRAYYVRGLIDGYAKNYKASEDDFQKFVDYYQKEWAGYNDLAWAYYQNKEYQKAVDTALKGLEVAPDNPWLLNGLGVSYNALGEKEKGQAALDKVATLAKDMKADDWRKAYPGNNPETAQWDLAQFRVDVSANLNLASNEFSSGLGKFTAACGGSFGTMGKCDGCTCNWGYQCDMGDDPYGHLHSWGDFLCSDGCGSNEQCCPPPPCSVSSWTPDPSTVCAGQPFTQTSNCGDTRGATGTKVCNGVCGGASGGDATCSLGSPLCAVPEGGTPDPANPTASGSLWSWYCRGVGVGHIDSPLCSHEQRIVDASCGDSNGGEYCDVGGITAKCKPFGSPYITSTTPSPPQGPVWTWSCSSSCNGAPSGTCTATKKTPREPACGSDAGQTFCQGSPGANRCATGNTVSNYTGGTGYKDYSWTCTGQCTSTPPVTCTAKGRGSCGWIETAP